MKNIDPKPGHRAKRYRLTRSLRAMALALVAAPVLIAIVWTLAGLPGGDKPTLNNWAASPSFSMHSAEAELVKSFTDSHSAISQNFLERERIVKALDEIKRQYAQGSIRSLADLDSALIELLESLDNRGTAIGTPEEYRHVQALLSGKQIGIPLSLSLDSATESWIVNTVEPGSTTAKSGLRKGDVLISFEGYHVEELKRIGDVPSLVNILIERGGILGSLAKITVRRGNDTYDFEIERVVTGGLEKFKVEELKSSSDSNLARARLIDVIHLEDDEFVEKFTERLKQLVADDVRGVVINLENLQGGNGDKAIQIAALFMDRGVVTHKIRPTGKGEIEMLTYFVKDDRVHLRVTGPFGTNADGSLNPEPNARQSVEALDWQANIFKGEVVIAVNNATVGTPELIAAALQGNRRATVVSNFRTAGKGTQQTTYEVCPERVIRFTTAYFLQPDGKDIEGVGIAPNVPGQGQDATSVATEVMKRRLMLVPHPELPSRQH